MSEHQLPPLLLLHGALGTGKTLDPIAQLLAQEYEILCPDLPGHGEHSGDGRAFTTMSLVDYVNDYITSQEIDPPLIFGYSLGGYVAMALAWKYPDSARGIMTLATKFAWDPDVAEEEGKKLDPAVVQVNAPEFVELLKKRHGEENWENVLNGTIELMERLGKEPVVKPENLKEIKIPVKLCVGSDDKMVTKEETSETADKIAQGSFEVLSGVKHPIEKVEPTKIADLIRQFAGNLIPSE